MGRFRANSNATYIVERPGMPVNRARFAGGLGRGLLLNWLGRCRDSAVKLACSVGGGVRPHGRRMSLKEHAQDGVRRDPFHPTS